MIEIGPESTITLRYDEAWLYCACLFENNKSDWRLATINETSAIPRGTWFKGKFSSSFSMIRQDDLVKLGVTPVRVTPVRTI